MSEQTVERVWCGPSGMVNRVGRVETGKTASIPVELVNVFENQGFLVPKKQEDPAPVVTPKGKGGQS